VYSLNQERLLDIVDEVSKICSGQEFKDFNIMYDSKFDELKMYESGTWENMFMEKGVKKLVGTIQSYYLDKYESYLLRKCKSGSISLIERNSVHEMLTEYYRFLGCFDLEPYVKNRPDSEIVNKPDDDEALESYTFETEFFQLYTRAVDSITKSELKSMKKNVVDIIRRNTKKNIDELNKRVMSLFNMDEKFKDIMVNTSTIS
jgi:hypothetical protein